MIVTLADLILGCYPKPIRYLGDRAQSEARFQEAVKRAETELWYCRLHGWADLFCLEVAKLAVTTCAVLADENEALFNAVGAVMEELGKLALSYDAQTQRASVRARFYALARGDDVNELARLLMACWTDPV